MIITLLTDFGLRDHYVAAIKGAILSRDPAITIVDISHHVPVYDVRAAAYLLGQCFRDFPMGTVHLVVIDPGVGSARGALCIATGGHYFVGPDNGVFSEIRGSDGEYRIHAIDPARIGVAEFSTTFHGRDIFAPAAAALATGHPIDRLGPAMSDLLDLGDDRPLAAGDGELRGRVVHVDRFGNCVTNLRPADFESPGWTRFRFEVAGMPVTETRGFYADGAPATPFVILGSGGRLEFAIDRGSAAEVLGIAVGEAVRAKRP